MKLLVHHSSCEMSPLSNDKYGNMLDSTIFLIHFTGESYLFLYNDIPYLKVFKLKKKKFPETIFRVFLNIFIISQYFGCY